MTGYTVVWSEPAKNGLAELWLENPAIRDEIRRVVDQIDKALAKEPRALGEPIPDTSRRLVVRPPISLVLTVSDEDCKVHVISIKLWDD